MMAADNLLPLFYDNSSQPVMSNSETEDVLAQLLGDSGDDLLASLLEPDSTCLSQMPPPLPSPLSADTTFPLDYLTDTRTVSPHSFSSGSPVGDSPENNSSCDVMMTSSSSITNDSLGLLLGSITGNGSGDSTADVKIDVEVGSRGRKAHTLVLTEEEKRLLTAEGVELPTDMPLTKTEQKHLKRVRRKIKNKLSAQESRRKKKEYVEGLEERVETCTQTNNQLRQKVVSLENENKSLLQKVQKLQSMVSHLYPGKLQTGSLLMVVSLCFSLLVWPRPPATPLPSTYSTSVHSRSLLFSETDEFGNIIDPQSGQIVSEQGGLSPIPPYPWTYQTPAYLHHTGHKIRSIET